MLKDRRREVLYSRGNITNKDVSKILGKEWHEMDETRKDSYREMANKMRLDHQLKYPGWLISSTNRQYSMFSFRILLQSSGSS